MTVASTQRQETPRPTFSRAEWMTLLAQAPFAALETHWNSIAHPGFQWIRRPEYGSAMIRGRASGTGALFNLGDVTVTRCTLQIDTGEIGIAYISGRNKRHAALAALFDGMMQREAETGRGVITECIDALAEAADRRRQDILAEAYSSKVDFTMMTADGGDE